MIVVIMILNYMTKEWIYDIIFMHSGLVARCEGGNTKICKTFKPSFVKTKNKKNRTKHAVFKYFWL